jgi:hypothetical protein
MTSGGGVVFRATAGGEIVDRGGVTGAGTGAFAEAGGVCVGGGGGGGATTGAAGLAAGGAGGGDATRREGAGRDGSGGARKAMRSERPTKPIATAAPPYASNIFMERPRLLGRGRE